MSTGYTVTGITYGTEQQSSGSWIPTVNVAYTTQTTPPVSGVVTLDASIVKDKVKYAQAVAAAIQDEADGHAAVLGLGQS